MCHVRERERERERERAVYMYEGGVYGGSKQRERERKSGSVHVCTRVSEYHTYMCLTEEREREDDVSHF